jgi:hypothetical protein
MRKVIDGIRLPLAKPSNLWEEELERSILEFSNSFKDITVNPVTHNITTITADYTISDQGVILGDATGGNITVTMLAAQLIKGVQYMIKKIDSSVNTVTIDGNGSETIDGATTLVLSTQYDSAIIISDGTNLHKF